MKRIEHSNKTKFLYYRISKIVYILGAPNYWYEDLKLPTAVKKIHDILSKILDILLVLFFVFLLGSFHTQKNLNEKQRADRYVFCFCMPLLYLFIPILSYHNEKIRDVAYNLAVKMKESYNDVEVEKQMIKQAKNYYILFGGFLVSAVIMYGLNGLHQVLTKGATFVTIISAWPDIEDTSQAAGIVRVIIYIIWWIYITRLMSTSYVVVVLITIGLSHQYKNLCSYFYSLRDIFKDERLSQMEKEESYVEAFKVGIQLHANTLRCTKLTQEICNVVFSTQITMNVTAIILFMFQMVNSERTPTNVASTVVTAVCTLISTGCLWWNAGDITVEASYLATAMFHSGWHHCRKEAALRVRQMLVIAMCRGQVPVELRCLGVVKLSYQSYVMIVRTSYSIFSVLY